MNPPIVERAFGLTSVQQGMLFNRVHGASSGVDIEQMIASLREPLRVPQLRAAWKIVVERHAALRTRFRWDDVAKPVQEVLAQVEMPFLETDLRDRRADEQETELARFLRDDRRRGIDLSDAPLCRVHLFRRGEAEYCLVWTFPHILLDGGSFPVVVKDLFTAYESLCRDEQPNEAGPRPYADHIAWLEQEVARKEAEAIPYFRRLLAGFGAKNDLGLSASAETQGSMETVDRLPRVFGELEQRLSAAQTNRLRTLAREHGLTLNTFVQAAWSLVVSDFSGSPDVVFGVVRAGRRSALPEAERMVGLFINTLPLRVQLSPARPTLDWLRDVRTSYVAARPFEHTPLSTVQSVAEISRGTPLFDSIVVYNDALMDSTMRALGGAFERRQFSWIEQTNFPVTLFAYGEPELLLRLSFDPIRVSDGLARAMLARAAAALIGLAQGMDRTLGDLERVPREESEAIRRWNDTAVRLSDVQTVHQSIERQAAATPDAVALVFRDSVVSYRALNERANGVARRLRALGVGPDVLVGIHVERSLEMVVGLLAILKAGGAYVPLDPHYPAERIAMMLADSRMPVIVSQRRLVGRLPHHSAAVLLLDEASTEEGQASAVESSVTSRNLAYVIFTSGSTGRPKGVMVEHRNVLNFFAGMDERLGTHPGVWLAVTSISFDISVLELFWTLARGFRVVIREDVDRSSPTRRARPAAAGRKIAFSLFYFAADAGEEGQNRYRLLLDGARYADAHGFFAIWTPERHFHAFGGLYPNPSLTSAALATITQHVRLCAGSVVLPLHNPIRVAEEWSVVDNLSNGRVGLSFASGWHANDFALMPDNYQARKEITFKGIETVKRLWRGDAVSAKSGNGAEISVRISPRPIQADPPIWVTAAGNVETFRMAGETGSNVLTNMLGQSVEDLETKLAAYRVARRTHGHGGDGHVTLMLHTFVGTDSDQVKNLVRQPFTDYLKTSTDLIKKARWEFPAFARPEGGSAEASIGERDLTAQEEDALMAHAFERYFKTHGLFGTPESCLEMVDKLKGVGVDEIACLIDFGVGVDAVLDSLEDLNRLRQLSNAAENVDQPSDISIPEQILRHGVTHLQCTPSLAGLVLDQPQADEALATLRTLMLGGEALPPALADRITAQFAHGTLLNMYGPTETTVWSTTAAIERGRAISIGRPIANTQIHILDSALQPASIGVPGELCIGGAGVVRGYLQRPDLTRERFIPDRFFGSRGAEDEPRLYRTGDLARFLEDGRIEFLGRLDHQVKVRGYRIELGEIEAVLLKHPSIRRAVVVARQEPSGDQRLVAYVVPRQEGAAPDDGKTAAWKNIWDDTYRLEPESGEADPTFNISGWNSSYTGEPIPAAEMRDWVVHTVDRLRSLGARRILEIGCGSGLLLFRLAPGCERYTGVDFSPAALDHIRATLARAPLAAVDLVQADAVQLNPDRGAYDAVIINSVAQYFPGVEYLVSVLEKALTALAPGGALFIGDVRSLPLLEAFHASLELFQAPDATPIDDAREGIRRRVRRESELVIDPAFFHAFAEVHGAVASVRIELKPGGAPHELAGFRYDVVLGKKGGVDLGELPANEVVEIDGRDHPTLASLRTRLEAAPHALRIRGLSNARLVREFEALARLESRADLTVGDLRAALPANVALGVLPEALAALHPDYEVRLTWGDDPRRFDATFLHRERGGGRSPRQAAASGGPPRPWQDYVHTGAAPLSTDHLAGELRAYLHDKLPDFMVPAHFVSLPSLPLTPNGKIDRGVLPAPETSRSTESKSFTPAATDLERTIVSVWQQVLHVDQIGVHDNFFDLGANSLLMMQANGRLRAVLGKPLSLVDMFQNPTISALAAHLAASEEGRTDAGSAAVKAGQDRALARRDAMSQRRERLASARQPPKR